MKALDKEGLDYLANKVYDAINSGGSADYIVEEGQNDIWYYRKWASGIAECWGRSEFSATTATSVNVNGYLPSGIMDTTTKKEIWASGRFNGVPDSHIGYTTCSDAGRYDVYIYRATTNSVAGAITINIKGLWKEFTPSISAKAQVGFEDLTSQVISGSSSFTLVTGSQTQCYRYGNLLYMRVRGTTSSTARNDWISIPLAKIPLTISHQMVGGCSINGNPSYPLISYVDWSGTQYITQQITNNIPASAIVVLWGIFLIKQ